MMMIFTIFAIYVCCHDLINAVSPINKRKTIEHLSILLPLGKHLPEVATIDVNNYSEVSD